MIAGPATCIYYANARLHVEDAGGCDRSRQSLAARRLAADLLAALTGSEREDWYIGREPGGRPRLDRYPVGWAGFELSLSHDGALVACAIARRRPVGIDIQHQRAGRNNAELARYCGWHRILPDLADPLGAADFTRLWTIWEACIKLLGRPAGDLLEQRFADAVAGHGAISIEQIGAAWIAVVA